MSLCDAEDIAQGWRHRHLPSGSATLVLCHQAPPPRCHGRCDGPRLKGLTCTLTSRRRAPQHRFCVAPTCRAIAPAVHRRCEHMSCAGRGTVSATGGRPALATHQPTVLGLVRVRMVTVRALHHDASASAWPMGLPGPSPEPLHADHPPSSGTPLRVRAKKEGLDRPTPSCCPTP